MNLAMLKHTLILLQYGKLNLETSLMELKLLLISICVQEKLNGMSIMDSSCYYLMVMMVKVLSILHAELKDFYNFVIKMNLYQKMEKLMIILKFIRT